MKSFEIRKSDISMDYRFEPSYYLYNVIIHKLCIEKGIEFDKMESLCTVISDGEHSAIPRRKEEGVRYLYGRNIKDGIINYDPFTDSSFISQEDYDHFTRIYVEDGDLLMTIVGTVGKVAVYQSSYVGTAGIPRHIAKIRLKKDSWATPEYLMAYFLSKLGKHQINNITTGNIQPLLSLNNIKKLNVPKIDETSILYVTKNMQKIVNLETRALFLLKQATDIFYKRVGIDFKEIDDNKSFTISADTLRKASCWTSNYSRPLYRNTLRVLRSRWPMVSLDEISFIAKGHEVGSDVYSIFTEKKDCDVPFVRTSDFVNFEVDQYPDFFIPEDIYNDLGQDIKYNDILFTNDGKIGMVALLTESDKFILQSHIRRIRLREEASKKYGLTPEYLFLLLSIEEIGLYQSRMYTVVQSTIPTMAGHLGKIELPILLQKDIHDITTLVRQAFDCKEEKKKLMKETRCFMDRTFDV